MCTVTATKYMVTLQATSQTRTACLRTGDQSILVVAFGMIGLDILLDYAT